MNTIWLDFETRSHFSLKEIGLDRYAKELTTEVLMLAYAFDDEVPKLWQCHLGPMPEELKTALLDETIKKGAWNYNFEKDILEYKLGIVIDQKLWVDPSVLCAYMSLPISLHKAGMALSIHGKKIHYTGLQRPVKYFGELRKTPKKLIKLGHPEWHFKDWNSDPEKWKEYCDYCLNDVVAERDVYNAALAFNSLMTEEEKTAWELDQRMNSTGVCVDQVFVKNAKDLAECEADEIIDQMKYLTGLENPNSPKQLVEWLKGHGYLFDSVNVESIEAGLEINLNAGVLDVLNLKQRLGGSAYKKLQSIIDRIGPDGRLRDQFVYHGAHTGRWAGRGVQLQNLYKTDKEVSKRLDEYVNKIRMNENIGDDISLMTVIASTVRASFCASPGNKLVVGDLAQIESRVLAVISKCHTMMDLYQKGHDLYIEFMAWLLKKETSEVTKEERARGKVVILGCFGKNTPVLTKRGWIPIIEVRLDDYVFDGDSWVKHDGIIPQGIKKVLNLNGVEVTPDHKVLTDLGWREFCQLKENTQLKNRAIRLAVGSLSNLYQNDSSIQNIYVNANYATLKNLLMPIASNVGKHNPASCVPINDYEKKLMEYISDIKSIQEKALTNSQINIMRLFPDAEEKDMEHTDILEEGSNANLQTYMNLWGTVSPLTDGIIQTSNWTEQTMTETTPLEIFDSSPTERIYSTEVFDILNAGKNNRFMILTNEGPMIVHNCGFQMGWEKFRDYAASFNITLTDSEAKEAVTGFRERYPEIVKFWEGINQSVIKAVKIGLRVYFNGLIIDGRDSRMLKIQLPSGRYLHYLNPKVSHEMTSWGKMVEGVSYTSFDLKGQVTKRLYGGLLTENVVQAIARDILLNGMILAEKEAEKSGGKLVLTIHDEIVIDTPIDKAFNLEVLLDCMRTVPKWGERMGFTLAAEGWEGLYYRKG